MNRCRHFYYESNDMPQNVEALKLSEEIHFEIEIPNCSLFKAVYV